jgi:hypothetical protein
MSIGTVHLAYSFYPYLFPIKIYKYAVVSNCFNGEILLVLVFQNHVRSYIWRRDCIVLYISADFLAMGGQHGLMVLPPSHMYVVGLLTMRPKCRMPRMSAVM